MPELDFDAEVRANIFEHFLRTGRAPLVAEIAPSLAQPLSAIQGALRRLHEAHAVVLSPSTGELLMVHPFSAMPTAFRVDIGDQSWWANCIWDALGVPGMLKRDGSVYARCGCCGDVMTLTIGDGALRNPNGVVPFSVSARDWWRDIVFT